ncbi:MAG: THUMP domain-containing protein, partial [Candidatus Hydrothermarchaeaceae archaeon]
MVRYGEIALKGEGVRRRFENKLIRNIEAALDVKHEIRRERGRIFVYTSKIEEAVKKLKNVFGIVSLSPCTITDSRVEAISEELLKTAKTRMQPEESFALRVRRAGAHEFSSQEVARKCGERIVKELGVNVDLVNPSYELFVEIRQDSAYIYTGVQNGFGGMPLGTQGSVVSLISGGIDSPVATFLIMKRGCKVLPVHYD